MRRAGTQWVVGWGSPENEGIRGQGSRSEARRDGSSSSLSPWYVPPLCSLPLSVHLSYLSVPELCKARPWVSTVLCIYRQENEQDFVVARTYSCESPNSKAQGPGSGLGVHIKIPSVLTALRLWPRMIKWGEGVRGLHRWARLGA